MQEASETMLRSVNRLYNSRKHSSLAAAGYHLHQLNEVRTNLADQLDCCKVGVAGYRVTSSVIVYILGS